MSHKFLTFPTNWPLESTFQNAYLALTGETIEAEPQQSADGSTFMIGTARLNEAHITQLLSNPDFAAALYIGDIPPPNWLLKEETPPE